MISKLFHLAESLTNSPTVVVDERALVRHFLPEFLKKSLNVIIFLFLMKIRKSMIKRPKNFNMNRLEFSRSVFAVDI
jgi:hypothetical protein